METFAQPPIINDNESTNNTTKVERYLTRLSKERDQKNQQ
jgi:hypothetical protein